MANIQRPRGTLDVNPSDSPSWRYIKEVAQQVSDLFGYGEIITPTIEHTELFERTVGETTDIVEKEMYTFEDRSGRSLTLRAEGTAPAARLYLEEKLYAEAQPVKLSYIGWPIFRYERPQAGRLREHHQFGVECFGSKDPALDAEIILLALEFLTRLGLSDLEVLINNIGCPECRSDYRQMLREYYESSLNALCTDCRRRYDTNPLRLLDCKKESCVHLSQNAPRMRNYLCDECSGHFKNLQTYLDDFDVEYQLDDSLVRGLDYYTKTVFEITHDALGAQDVVCGGGRYDGLIEMLGGDATPGVGFGMGMERLLLIMQHEEIPLPSQSGIDAFVVTIGDEAKRAALSLINELRTNEISADTDYLDRSVRAQMRYADKYPARFVLIMGEDELDRGVIAVRDMEDGSQTEISDQEIVSYLRSMKLGQ